MITAVIPCMGRKSHLEISLSRAIDTFDRVIVVDWSCPQESGAYASEEGASVVYKYGEKYYSGSKAKNFGARLVATDYICFLDADAVCMPGMKEALAELVSPDSMVLSARNLDGTDVNDTMGFLVCPTQAFRSVEGFDEVLWQGWGHEDVHLRGKLFLEAKLSVKRLPMMMLGALAHGNDLRNRYAPKPISETALSGFPVLSRWFAERGIENFHRNPTVKDIVFSGRYNVD